jgi:catechol 2,3-dioxygenase-like lactoylglutathione lyase family enzyme
MDRLDQLLTRYDRREISRRDLLGAIAMLGLGGVPGVGQPSAAQGRTLNHVSLGVADLRRSTEFYDRLLRLPVRDRGADYCEYRLTNAFLGLYQQPDMRRGLDHVAIGVEGYDAKATLRALQRTFPDASPELLYEDQVYIADPDGARIQLCAVEYKRQADP